MSSIKVEKTHSLSIDDAKKAIDGFGKDLESKYMMKLAWKGNEAELKGPGASGNIQVTDDRIVVNVKLGMMAKAAGIKADKVQASIDKRLTAALSGE